MAENKLTVSNGQRVILAEDCIQCAAGEVGILTGWVQGHKGLIVNAEMDCGAKVSLPAEMFIDLPMSDPLRIDLIKAIDKQFAKGVLKYGATLHENPKNLSTLNILDYLSEELVDGLHYIRKLKMMMVEEINRLNGSR